MQTTTYKPYRKRKIATARVSFFGVDIIMACLDVEPPYLNHISSFFHRIYLATGAIVGWKCFE